MSDMPERIWAWPFNPGWGGYWRENPDAVKREDGGAIFIRADLAIDAMTLERAARVLLNSHTVQTMIAAGKRLDLEEVLRAIVEAGE